MSTRFGFGELVVCTEPALAAPAAPGAASVGLLAELRRTDCRVQYLRAGRGVWVPLRAIRAARPEEIEGTLEKMIAGLLSLLGATEMELTILEGGRCRLAASHGTLLPGTVDEVRARLGGRLLKYLIRPHGMHRLQTVLEMEMPEPAAG